jgi:hypothetical protein
MNRAIRLLTALTLVFLCGWWQTAQAQTVQRAGDEQLKNMLERIERGADSFKSSLKDALDETRFNSTRSEDNINEFVKQFEMATDRLKQQSSDRNTASSALQEVLTRAATINNFMSRYPLTQRAQSDWEYLRMNLNELARVQNVNWTWPAVSAARPYRMTDQQLEGLLESIEKKSDNFRAALKSSLEQTRFDDTKLQDEINQYVRDFERATDRLEERYDDDFMTTGAATEVLRRAVVIDRFLQRNKLTPSAQNAWPPLRSELDDLAKAYNFTMNWKVPTLLILLETPAGQVAGREPR